MKAGTEKRFSPGACLVISLLALAGAFPNAARAAVPTDPVTYTSGTPLLISGGESDYWTYVPNSYDGSHDTPIKLLVWLHGCGGYSSGDIWTASPGGAHQTWITVAPLGREGGCWDPGLDQSKVLKTAADVSTHFNIDPRQVILGGYSSGGDLAYRTAFYNASHFAGVLAENTAPFSDTGSSQEDSLAAAAWKFNVIHLAHNQDGTYPVAEVENQTDAMIASGFPVQLIKVDGNHYDDANATANGHAVPGTTADLRTLLLPHMNDGWLSPEPTSNPVPDPGAGPGPGPAPGPDPDPGPGTDQHFDPRVKIKAAPSKVTASRKAKFRFKSSISGSGFECRIDRGKFHRCTSPKLYRRLRTGHHVFRVQAIFGGAAGPVVSFGWKVRRRSGFTDRWRQLRQSHPA